ncbi:hypothetical protein [Methylobacterium sp. JK268]
MARCRHAGARHVAVMCILYPETGILVTVTQADVFAPRPAAPGDAASRPHRRAPVEAVSLPGAGTALPLLGRGDWPDPIRSGR